MLEITHSNEQRIAEVFELQIAISSLLQVMLNSLSVSDLGDIRMDELEQCRKGIETLARRQQTIMEQISSQSLPGVPLRRWACRSLRERYFAERAQLLVLQKRMAPLLVSARYVEKAFNESRQISI